MWRLSLQFFSWSDTAFLALTNVVVLSSIIRVFKSTPSSFRDFWHFIVRATGRSLAICAVAFPCGYGIGNTALSTCYIEKRCQSIFLLTGAQNKTQQLLAENTFFKSLCEQFLFDNLSSFLRTLFHAGCCWNMVFFSRIFISGTFLSNQII